jgi:Putative zinc-finger
MRCGKVRAIIPAEFIDGELDPASRAIVEKHVEECPDCRQYLEEMKEFAGKLDATPETFKAPLHMWAGVEERIECKKNIFASVFEVIEDLFAGLRRPLLKVAVVMSMLFIFVGVRGYRTFRYQGPLAYVETEMDYLDSLAGDDQGAFDDIGIPLEEFST